MRKFITIIFILFFASIGYGQEKPNRIELGLFSSHPFNFEYVDGKVKEIHYQAFHITDEDGKIKKGELFKFAEAEGVTLRQPWSYYYNELGQMVKKAVKTDADHRWIGVIHYGNDKIENIYWLKEDTLMMNQDIVYLDNGNVERHWTNIQNNEFTGKTIFLLDKNGDVLKEVSQNKDGEVWYTNEFTRNSDGTVKTQKGINAEGNVNIDYSDYEYNEKGLFKTAHMNILKGEEVDQQWGEIEYEFDERGNWIKWISRGWLMIERTIVYYD